MDACYKKHGCPPRTGAINNCTVKYDLDDSRSLISQRKENYEDFNVSSNTLQKTLNSLSHIELRVLMNDKLILNKIFCMD